WPTRPSRPSGGIVSSRSPSSTTARARSQAPVRISSARSSSGPEVGAAAGSTLVLSALPIQTQVLDGHPNVSSKLAPMAIEQRADAEAIRAGRRRDVARGLARNDVVVDRAEGATIWDADGRAYLDFAGGIACQNLGHGPEAVVDAIHDQAERYLHQCFMVGLYEPYIEVCRRLDELWPGGAETKSLLVNSGAEAVENAVKIARTATGRPGVVVFDRSFHGRTNLTMAMTSKLVYKKGFGPLAADVYRAPAPYEFRGVTTADA